MYSGDELYGDEVTSGLNLDERDDTPSDPYDTAHGHGPACWEDGLEGGLVRVCGWDEHEVSADDRKRIAVGLEQRAAEIERTDAVGAAALRRIAAEWRQGRKT